MDLLSIFVLAAEGAAAGAEHADKSETPFYIVGGLLAVFAIVVGITGIRQPNLGEGPNRAFMAIGALLVVAVMITSIAVS
jgi:hypothetical protein